jgi:peptidoglycan hydrolase-like protein with peptidoglycan-binding domain
MCEVQLPILKKGMKNSHVKALQTLLTLAGYECSIDGSFGSKTESSLIKFQNENNLEADGVCGSDTWKALI